MGGGGGGRGRDSRSPPRRRRDSRTPPRSAPKRGEAPPDQIMTLLMRDLPPDQKDDVIIDDLMGNWSWTKVLRVLVMRKGDINPCSAFVRFETREDALRALDDVKDGKVEVNGKVCRNAEMARRNTEY